MHYNEYEILERLKSSISSTQLKHWSQRSYWTPEQAVTVLLGIDPHEINSYDWYKIRFCNKHAIVKEYTLLVQLLKTAVNADDIPYTTQVKESGIGFYDCCIRPLIFIEWAKKKDLQFSTELETLVRQYSLTKDIDWESKYKELEIENNINKAKIDELNKILKPLHGGERNSTTKLIAVVILANYEQLLSKENIKDWVAEFSKDSESVGINLDNKTLKQKLTLTKEFIEKRRNISE